MKKNFNIDTVKKVYNDIYRNEVERAKKYAEKPGGEYIEPEEPLQSEVAAKLNCAQSTISKLTKGYVFDKSKGELVKVAPDTINDIISKVEVYSPISTIFIKTSTRSVNGKTSRADSLSNILLKEYGATKDKAGIVSICKIHNGLIIYTNDLNLGETLKSISNK